MRVEGERRRRLRVTELRAYRTAREVQAKRFAIRSAVQPSSNDLAITCRWDKFIFSLPSRGTTQAESTSRGPTQRDRKEQPMANRLCTACHPERLYSWRKGNRGRLVTVAALPR
jgi:hypothetical protein